MFQCSLDSSVEIYCLLFPFSFLLK
uniref:Uncharacterized protein n=1 Tax=Anguilla anguilla TaxID=7936 RepID=A0A0E9Y0X0_ANGAN